MIAIRQEIRDIEEGRMPRNDNPLKNAPHSALDLLDEEWKRPYFEGSCQFSEGSERRQVLVPGESN
jgi:glycine cleavage system protein P-like pyridoxal-binding family